MIPSRTSIDLELRLSNSDPSSLLCERNRLRLRQLLCFVSPRSLRKIVLINRRIVLVNPLSGVFLRSRNAFVTCTTVCQDRFSNGPSATRNTVAADERRAEHRGQTGCCCRATRETSRRVTRCVTRYASPAPTVTHQVAVELAYRRHPRGTGI